MVDVILDTQDIRVLGGPSEVNLELDFGKPGSRGSYIYAGEGQPSSETIPATFQLNDLYLNTDINDKEYSCLYQYITAVVDDVPINKWELILRLAPVQKAVNATVTFDNGVGTYSIEVHNDFPLVVLNEIAASTTNIQASFKHANPVVFSISDLGITSVQSPLNTTIDIELTGSELVAGDLVLLDGQYEVQILANLLAEIPAT